jgi:hypothetical protein
LRISKKKNYFVVGVEEAVSFHVDEILLLLSPIFSFAVDVLVVSFLLL